MLLISLFLIIHLFNLKIENGIYIIKNLDQNYYITISRNNLILSIEQTNFRLISVKSDIFIIETKHKKKKLGVNNNDKIILYNNKNINNKNVLWKITGNFKKGFFIKNLYSNKYIEIDNNSFKCSTNFINKQKINSYLFSFFKLCEEGVLNIYYLNIINNEPIDLVIKYIDLTDIELKREGIKQIYKDKDNEELRFCIRSIIQYIPWVRKIYILMPNKKVKYFKSIEEINYKIIYIKDKELLGFDSANIHSFTFNLFNLEKYGISKNFIYMEDDFFIGKTLNKKDFFYYDEIKREVVPYLLTKFFQENNKTSIMNQYYNLLEKKDFIHPHSNEGWWFSIYNTNKYFMEHYKLPLINTNFTHNAIAENIDDLKEIYEEIQDYKYINETLYSKERHILMIIKCPNYIYKNIYQ